jgi:hypothetical protein
MSVSGTDFLLNLMTDIFSCRFFSQLPRLDGSRTKSSNRRADGVSSPNLACLLASLLASKQPGALLAKLCVAVTGFCYFFGR